MTARAYLKLVCVLVLLFGITNSSDAQQKRNPRRAKARTTTAKSIEATDLQRKQTLPELPPLPPDPQVENADIAITAHVRARSLKFDVVPNATVVFSGQPNRDTVWESDRENLPTPVQPGVTYRDIGIRLKITSVFSDIDRIVAEALGEVPTEQDSLPAPKPSDTATPTAPTPSAKVAVSTTKRGRKR